MKKRGLALLVAIVMTMSAGLAAAEGWQSSGGRWWYSYADGGFAQNTWLNDGSLYYFDSEGWMVTGWRQIAGTWYYFTSDGAMAMGWQEIGGVWYYFAPLGAMATGWKQIGGVWYYFTPSGAMATGWKEIGGVWYYFAPSGAMATGWQQIGGAWYYFAPSGAMATGWKQIGSAWYYFDPSGAMHTGWLQQAEGWYWFDTSGAMRTGIVNIDGMIYKFDTNGLWIEDYIQTGWVNNNGDYSYILDDGTPAKGWQQIDDVWYCFNESGVMRTGWVDVGEDWYYLNAGGAMVTSDTLIDGTLCAFDESGKYLGKADPIKLVVWSFTNELQSIIEKYFIPDHPEIEFEFQIYPTDGSAYTTKVDNTFGADPTTADAPDIFTLEAAFVKHYVESDWTGDLKEVGFTDEELAAAFPVMAQIGQNAAGVQKGLSWQSTPGVLMYRASLAEKYLGVKTPEEFQEKVKDWDTFLETAEELKTASEGACKMVIGAGDIWNAYQYQRAEGWVVDNKLVIDDELLDFEELCKTLEEDDLTHKGGAWSEVWFSGMRGELETLCYFLPTWGLQYTLKPNCVVGWDYDNPDSEENIKNATENGTYGDWRLADGPVAYNWGGTWMGINAAKTAAASEAKKTAMHDLIYDLSLNEKTLEQYAKDTGDFVGSAKAMEKIAAESNPDPFLGGQNSKPVFVSAASKANGKIMGEYDDTINGLWNDYVTWPYSRGEMGLDECISNFKTVLREAIPSITVE